MTEHLRTHDFHTRHALVRIDVQGWTYRGVCACGHVGPRIDGWPAHHHVLLADHLDRALREEGAPVDEQELRRRAGQRALADLHDPAQADRVAEARERVRRLRGRADDLDDAVEAATGDPLWGRANDFGIQRCHGCRALHEPEDGTTYEHRPGCPGVCVQEGCRLPGHLPRSRR